MDDAGGAHAVLVGFGAVGRHVAEYLLERSDLAVTVLHRGRHRPADVERLSAYGGRFTLLAGRDGDLPPADVVVLARPKATALARRALRHGSHVVAVADDPVEVRSLLDLDGAARRVARSVVVGAAMSPGLSSVLACFAATELDRVDEVHVASFGTGGPACARQHHGSFSVMSEDWVDGTWRRRPGGSGRELVWFPDPVGGADCYRAALADTVLLVPAFPGVRRVTARRQATRRDRLTSALPMLRPPHPEGLLGAVRAEVRGWVGDTAHTITMGAVARPAEAAGAVAAVAATWAVAGRFRRSGAAGLAELVERPGAYLHGLSELGLVVSEFEGGVIGG